MPTSTPRTSKSKSWLVIFGVVSVFLLIFMLSLAYVLVFRPTETTEIAATHTRLPALSLPTASVPTNTPGPPLPEQVLFTAQEPIKGFSNCEQYGFYGIVQNSHETLLRGVQVVVWDNQAGLVALNAVDGEGNYQVELTALPSQQKLWVQIYENDLPVSQPLLVEPNIDCQNGFQIYEINWQRLAGE
ncbi:MAG: hypothetical protein KDJ65_02240 [Anaerolineae bacterium]|nr:hypothetical protein [Anaerolineae bacterium]